eukprot:940350-Amphidinium_carterae.1
MRKGLLRPVRERVCALDASSDLPLVRYERAARVVSSKRGVKWEGGFFGVPSGLGWGPIWPGGPIASLVRHSPFFHVLACTPVAGPFIDAGALAKGVWRWFAPPDAGASTPFPSPSPSSGFEKK